MGRRVLAFVLALVATYTLASVAISQAVLAYLASLGRDVGFGERLAAIGHDLVGLLPVFGVIVLVTLLIAYGVVALIAARAPGLRLIGYVIGGFSGMVAVHLLVQAQFEMAPIWSVRDAYGILLQGLSGAVGGYLFARLNPRPAA